MKFIQFKKDKGGISPLLPKDSAKVKSLKDGVVYEALFYEVTITNKNQKIASIKTNLKKIATMIGYNFEELQDRVKRRNGLIFEDANKIEHEKSFADATDEEFVAVLNDIDTILAFLNPPATDSLDGI